MGPSQGENLRTQLLEVAEAPPCQLHWAAVGKLLTVPSIDPGEPRDFGLASKTSWMKLGYKCVLTLSVHAKMRMGVYIKK